MAPCIHRGSAIGWQSPRADNRRATPYACCSRDKAVLAEDALHARGSRIRPLCAGGCRIERHPGADTDAIIHSEADDTMAEADDRPHDAGENGLTQVVHGLIELGQSQAQVSVQDIQHALGERGFGPFLLVPAIIELSPIGAIPGLPTSLALIVVLSALQLLFGRRHFWLPAFLHQRSASGERVEKAMKHVLRAARWVDKRVHPRMRWAAREPFIHISALLCILLAATVPPLELMPFASSAPFAAIGLLGLGLMVRDGVVVLVASAASIAALVFAYLALF
ncbi:exopolysaccharide biosynthesis protein [Lysobacter sp. D1-1-M9]|uniref:exopolysaccharide biosynthesis protein n=1 Tax=Novilysobacter longmucuonensis TaxID=3098603 RepID=UPI00320089BE